jgi:hypothetical protein
VQGKRLGCRQSNSGRAAYDYQTFILKPLILHVFLLEKLKNRELPGKISTYPSAKPTSE